MKDNKRFKVELEPPIDGQKVEAKRAKRDTQIHHPRARKASEFLDDVDVHAAQLDAPLFFKRRDPNTTLRQYDMDEADAVFCDENELDYDLFERIIAEFEYFAFLTRRHEAKKSRTDKKKKHLLINEYIPSLEDCLDIFNVDYDVNIMRIIYPHWTEKRSRSLRSLIYYYHVYPPPTHNMSQSQELYDPSNAGSLQFRDLHIHIGELEHLTNLNKKVVHRENLKRDLFLKELELMQIREKNALLNSTINSEGGRSFSKFETAFKNLTFLPTLNDQLQENYSVYLPFIEEILRKKLDNQETELEIKQESVEKLELEDSKDLQLFRVLKLRQFFISGSGDYQKLFSDLDLKNDEVDLIEPPYVVDAYCEEFDSHEFWSELLRGIDKIEATGQPSFENLFLAEIFHNRLRIDIYIAEAELSHGIPMVKVTNSVFARRLAILLNICKRGYS
ncbi:hypothetical protein PCE1_002741 [Barthelona sp. PCE]